LAWGGASDDRLTRHLGLQPLDLIKLRLKDARLFGDRVILLGELVRLLADNSLLLLKSTEDGGLRILLCASVINVEAGNCNEAQPHDEPFRGTNDCPSLGPHVLTHAPINCRKLT
jgi:hypothetical protein